MDEDRILDEIATATEAINEASDQMETERTTRRIQMGALLVAVVLLGALLVLSFRNDDRIEDQGDRTQNLAERIENQADRIQDEADRQALADCESRNDTREAIREVILVIVAQDPPETAGEQAQIDAILESLDTGVLATTECEEPNGL